MPSGDGRSAKCPGCGAELWKRRGGEYTLANRILKLGTDGGIVAKCPDCRTEVPVPFLTLEPPAAVRLVATGSAGT